MIVIYYENNYLNVTKSFQQTILTSWDPGDFPHVYFQAPPTPTLQPACMLANTRVGNSPQEPMTYLHAFYVMM